MNYVSCEAFMDYSYGEDNVAIEGFIEGLKEKLRSLCAKMYTKCFNIYEANKDKHPKIASIFNRLAGFFKRHSNIVDKIETRQEINKESEQLKKATEEVKHIEAKYVQKPNRKVNSSSTSKKSIIIAPSVDKSDSDKSYEKTHNTQSTIDENTKFKKEFKGDGAKNVCKVPVDAWKTYTELRAMQPDKYGDTLKTAYRASKLETIVTKIIKNKKGMRDTIDIGLNKLEEEHDKIKIGLSNLEKTNAKNDPTFPILESREKCIRLMINRCKFN